MDTSAPAPLRWPPPALERLQGDLARVAARGALAGGLLVAPFLFSTARQHGFASQGPFADAWWVTVVLATVGLGFALDALASAGRIMRRAADAMAGGYSLETVLHVLADARKDMGFLIQGGRHFSVMEPRERETVARLRVGAAMGQALAGLWLPSALGAGLLLSAWGVLDGAGLVWVTLIPGLLLYLAAAVLAAYEDGRVRRARTAWYRQPWALDLDAREIGAWSADLASRTGQAPEVTGASVPAGALRRAALLTGVLTVVVAVPVLTLVPASAIGPLLARVALPRLGQVQERAARAEAFRGFRLPQDGALDAAAAGQLLHDLLYVGRVREPAPGERPPARVYDASWLPAMEGPNPVGVEPHRWADGIFAKVADEPTPELITFLEGIAAHPAQGDFAALARSRGLDVAGARWEDPLPAGATTASLPIPTLGTLRDAANARLAAAAADLARGRVEDAETKVREILSVGFLLGDEGPTLIDNLIGYVLVGSGGTALERLYEVTGREAEAEGVRIRVRVAERSVRRAGFGAPQGTEAFLRALPSLVADTSNVRGLRWEYLVLTTTLSPCLNLNRMVFGADEEYTAFLERAHGSLVRWPSEEQLFALARNGYWGSVDRGESLFGRFMGVAMRGGPGTCSDVIRRFGVLREAM